MEWILKVMVVGMYVLGTTQIAKSFNWFSKRCIYNFNFNMKTVSE